MANKLDPMDIKQIITLHLDGESNRSIEKLLGISRNTVNKYIQMVLECGKEPKELLTYPEGSLKELFTTLTTINNPRYEELMRFFISVKRAQKHPGFTFLQHYYQYEEQAKEPYSYTQFVEHYHRKYSREKGSLKLDHPPGKEVYIDFAGKKLSIVDKDSGEVKEVEVFVAILPNSQYTYFEACYSQKREDLIRCMGHALSFFGGTPQAIVSDNLKSSVTRSSKYEAIINKTFKDFARHYSCVINPTRAYRPQDKALVENAVNLGYQRIYHPMREMTFFSLTELNQYIRSKLDSYNDQLFQRKEASRKELFQSVEQQHLKPLPDQGYDIKGYTRAKVQKMGYVFFSPEKSYYSVPYRYIGHTVQVEYTSKTVEVFYNHQRIATHNRIKVKGIYTTNKEHLSSHHQAYTQWSPDYFHALARKQGQQVEALIRGVLQMHEYPEIGYKRAMGIIQLHKQYGSDRLNNACELALQHDIYSYHRVKNILKNQLDKVPLFDKEPPSDRSHIPVHRNIRGANNYQ